MSRYVLALTSVLMGASLAFAQAIPTEQDCQEKIEIVNGIQVNRQYSAFNNECYVLVDPSYTSDLVYKSFLFSTEGMIMVFNSFGDGPTSTTTGARVYFTFPRFRLPDYEISKDRKSVTVSLASSGSITFSTADMKVISVEGAQYSDSAEVSKHNNGGFEFFNYSEMLFDLGFRMGESPAVDPWRVTKVMRPGKKTCGLTNADLYDNGNLKIVSDNEIYDFVTKFCVDL